ncbi:hypothetical protein VNI00_008891 [Paramarasmius palmivorus]|uniref:Uncharacterized protein n=1 Tax=Paramarasmius palmivorus TaxID=297713 RepID=A0AAW0CRL3_9AGAR
MSSTITHVLEATFDFGSLLQQAFTNEDQDPHFEPEITESPLTSPPPSPERSVLTLPSDDPHTDGIVHHSFDPQFTNNLPYSTTVPPSDISPATDRRDAQSKHHARSKGQSKKARALKRKLVKLATPAEEYQAPPTPKRRHLETREDFNVDLDFRTIQVSANGFTGNHSFRGLKREYTLEEVVGKHSKFKYKLIKWDGSKTLLLATPQRELAVVCARNPQDSNWEAVWKRAASKLEEARKRLKLSKKQKNNRQGHFGSRTTALFTKNLDEP